LGVRADGQGGVDLRDLPHVKDDSLLLIFAESLTAEGQGVLPDGKIGNAVQPEIISSSGVTQAGADVDRW